MHDNRVFETLSKKYLRKKITNCWRQPLIIISVCHGESIPGLASRFMSLCFPSVPGNPSWRGTYKYTR